MIIIEGAKKQNLINAVACGLLLSCPIGFLLEMQHYLFIWLIPQAGKIKQILSSYWLPKRARWSLGMSRFSPARKRYLFGHIWNPLFSWPSVFGQDGFMLASLFLAFLLTSTTQKKKAHSQYPAVLTEYAWSIMYIEMLMVFTVFF